MSYSDRIEGLFQEYEKQRNSLTEMQAKMSALSATAMSPRREVSVTVGQNGVLNDVQFPSGAHKRLATADLTRLILETYAEVKEQVMNQAAQSGDKIAGLISQAITGGDQSQKK